MQNNNHFLATASGGSSFDLVPAGLHPAVLVAMYDVGLQYSEAFNTTNRKVVFRFEFPTLPKVEVEVDGKKQPMPRILDQKFTLSLHEKAGMRAMLESWRGRPFNQDELAGFDISKVLGVGVTVQVMHKLKKDGSSRAEIRNLLPLPKPQWPTASNQPFLFSVRNLTSRSELDKIALPKWVAKMVVESKEWEKLGKSESRQEQDRSYEEQQAAVQEEDDQGLPF